MKFRTKLILLFIGLALLTNGLLFIINTWQASKMLRAQIGTTALSIAATASALLDGDLHATLVDSADAEGEAYKNLEAKLRKVRDANRRDDVQLKFVYTTTPSPKDEGVVLFAVDAEEAGPDKSLLGDLYMQKEVPGTLPTSFEENQVQPVFVEDQWGTWLSANSPLRSSSGNSVGVVSVDIDAKEVIERLNTLKYIGLAALSIAWIRVEETPRQEREQTVWQEMRDGLKVLQERPSVRSALLQLVLLYSLLAALYVLAISLASAIQQLGPTQFGTLLAMSGIGLAVGAVSVAQVGHRFNRRRLASAGLGTIAWSLVLLGQLRGNLVFTLVLCGVLGLGAALLAIPAQTTIQEDTPEAMRGKVFGLQNNLINIALSLPLVLAGTVVSRYGLLPVLWALAALALVAALLVTLLAPLLTTTS